MFDGGGADDRGLDEHGDWEPLAHVAQRPEYISPDESGALRAEAEDEARQIVQQARAEADRLTTQRSEELGRAKAAADAFGERVEQVAADLEAACTELLERIQPHVLALTAQMATKVIKRAIAADNTIVVDVVRDTLCRVSHSHRVRVYVNPKDREAVDGQMQQLLRILDEAERFEIVADDEIDEGGCVVRTDQGEIDARIETQLDALRSKADALARRVIGGP